MPNIGSMLKQEIRRLAKREAKALVVSVKKSTVALKRSVWELKRQLMALGKQGKMLGTQIKGLSGIAPPAPAEEPANWVTSRGIKSLRKNLRLSQADFAKLIGVNQFSVNRWEHKGKKLEIRSNKILAIVALRKIGVREARLRLEGMKKAAGRKVAGKAKRLGKVKRPSKAKLTRKVRAVRTRKAGGDRART